MYQKYSNAGMDLQQKITALGQCSLFSHLSRDALAVIAQKATTVQVQTGDILIHQEDAPDAVFFITSGSVKVYVINPDGEEIPLVVKGPGEVVGEMGIIDDKPRAATVAALLPTHALLLSKNDFVHILRQYPEVAIHLLKVLSDELRKNTTHMEQLSQSLVERTWQTLLALEKFFPDHTIMLSQEELAAIIGATRARITEVLNTLAKEGKITLAHRNIHIN